MTKTTADMVLTNGKIYTVDPGNPRAECLAIRDGRILALGNAHQMAPLVGESTEVRDLHGAFTMPGFVDVHNHHFIAGKESLFELQIPQGASLDGIIAAVAQYAETLGPADWIIGGPWASDRLTEISRLAALNLLDGASGGRPVMLSDDAHHNRWVNTQAMKIAGINPSDIGVVTEDGRPTGVLLEAAGLPVAHAQRAESGLTPAEERDAVMRGVELLNSYGVTSFQDAGVTGGVLEALRQLDSDGSLNAWVVTSLLVNDEVLGYGESGESLVFSGEQYRTPHHRPDFVKIFLDGVPPTRTGAFLEPYLPDDIHGANHRGEALMDPAELTDWLRRTAQAGLSAKIHCTGDASVHAVLNAVETIRSEGYTAPRYQVAHGQFVHPDDIPRFAALGVAADISPFIWVPGPIVEAIRMVLPGDRAERIQPNRSLLDAGAIVAGGSDWPVSPSPNPWEGIHGLVTREDPSGTYPGKLWPEQAITLSEAIATFTAAGAEAMGLSDDVGSLEVGKSADFIILNRDPFAYPESTIVRTKVKETWFAGRCVYAETAR